MSVCTYTFITILTKKINLKCWSISECSFISKGTRQRETDNAMTEKYKTILLRKLTAWFITKQFTKTNITYNRHQPTTSQLINYRLSTWARHIKNVAGLNMFVSSQHSLNLGRWCYKHNIKDTDISLHRISKFRLSD